MNFENKTIGGGIYYSRIIASWNRVGGSPVRQPDLFKEWLESLGLTKDQVWDVYDMATNGKLELEILAKTFLEENINKSLRFNKLGFK